MHGYNWLMPQDSWHFRAAAGERLHESPPSAGRIQGALRRLVRLDLADVTANGWMLADPEFAAWVREVDTGPSRECSENRVTETRQPRAWLWPPPLSSL